jgi:predicted ArsR family transcriptional regulator
MQSTRESILNILKEHGQATVDELSQELDLTTVTIRHHLDILRGNGLVAAPFADRRKAPGRPKYVYSLTEKASSFFPKMYDNLVSLMLNELRSRLSPDEVDEVMKNIGEHIAQQAVLPDEGGFQARLTAVAEFLDGLGYMAHWEHHTNDDYLLHIANCPYESVARKNHRVCAIDEALLTHLLGTSPERISWAARGDHECTYVIHPASE